MLIGFESVELCQGHNIVTRDLKEHINVHDLQLSLSLLILIELSII